jgi:hypothetical protein
VVVQEPFPLEDLAYDYRHLLVDREQWVAVVPSVDLAMLSLQGQRTHGMEDVVGVCYL